MSNTLVGDRDRDSVNDWQSPFLAHVLPVVTSLASIRFRNLPATERDEAIADATATATIAFVRLTNRGKDPTIFAWRLAKYAVMRVLSGRASGSSDNSGDVLSRLAQRRRGFRLLGLDSVVRRHGQEWESALVENGTITPADLAASRIDFREWMGRMKHRRREIAQTLAAGYRTEEVAEIFQLSPGRVSQLRREFEASWREFQRDARQVPIAA